MSRPFRPFAKIPVKISFKSHTRSKNEVWERGFIKIIESGGCIELSDFYKKHASLPIERLYKNKNILRGSDSSPYIFSVRLDAKNSENGRLKLVRLNFNGNLEGYEYALKSLNNAFETFSERFHNQAKTLPEFRKEAKKIKNSKTAKNEKRLNTKKNEVQERVRGADKATNATENFREINTATVNANKPHSRSVMAQKLLAPPPPPKKQLSWQSELDRILGDPVEAPRKILDPQEEARLAEIRNRNALKLEQRRKERAEKRKEKPAEKPIRREEESVLMKKKNVDSADIIVVKQEENPRKKSIEAEYQAASKEQKMESWKEVEPEKRRKTFDPTARTLLYDFGREKNLLNVFSVVEVSLDPKEGRLPRKQPVAKRLALRQGSVVRPSEFAGFSKKPSRKDSERSNGSSKKSTNPRKRARQESSSSSSSDDSWRARPRGFSPPPSIEKPKYSSSNSKKPGKPRRKAVISSDSDFNEPSSWDARGAASSKPKKSKQSLRRIVIFSDSDSSDNEQTPINEPFWDAPEDTSPFTAYSHAITYEPAPRDPSVGSTEDSSGYSTGTRSNSHSSDHPIDIKDIKVEPEDYKEFPDQLDAASLTTLDNQQGFPMEHGQIEQKTPENSEIVYSGQHFIGMTFNNTTIINSRLVDCDIQNSTIINCSIENSSISNSRVTSQTV